MLLDGLNHVALISNDVARLGAFYAEVFDAEVGDTRPHLAGVSVTKVAKIHRLKYAPCIVARSSASADVQIRAGAAC